MSVSLLQDVSKETQSDDGGHVDDVTAECDTPSCDEMDDKLNDELFDLFYTGEWWG